MQLTSSKYKESKIYLTENGLLDIFSSDFIANLKSNSNSTLHTITAKEAYRLDLICKNIYGNFKYYWILLQLNSFRNIFELSEGQQISIPSELAIASALSRYKNT